MNKGQLRIMRAGTFVVPVCVECNKELDENEIGYGHDCEVSPSSAVEYYNYEADKCSCDVGIGHDPCDLCLDKIAKEIYNKEEK
jgi:hypothetical protein